jgi:hypothetical protein
MLNDTNLLVNVPSHDVLARHTYSGGAALDLFGLSAADTLAKLTPSSAPGAASAVLKTDSSGVLQLEGLGLGIAPLNLLHARTNPATTNTVVDVLRVDRTTSGTAEDGIGAGLVLYAEDASGNVEEAGRIQAVFTTAAHATQAGRVDIVAMGAATGAHITSDGNVGIGTTGPGQKLVVQVPNGQTADFRDYFSEGATLRLSAISSQYGTLSSGEWATRLSSSKALLLAAEGAQYQAFYTNGSERMRIDSAGNVGIGTASPSNPLHGATNPATTNTVVDVLRLDRTTSGTAADGIGAGLVLYAEDASGNIEEAGRINAVFTTAAHATQAGQVDITAMGAATGIHIFSDGKVSVGTTGTLSGYTFYVAGLARFNDGIGYAGGTSRLANMYYGGATGKEIYATGIVQVYSTDSPVYIGSDGKLVVDFSGNVIVGATAAGATAAGVLALGGAATAPTTSVDLVHLYGEDISAGNRALAVYQESAVIAAAGIASTHKIPVKWNGTVYYLMASNV